MAGKVTIFVIAGLIFLASIFFSPWLFPFFLLLLFLGTWYFFENLSLFALGFFYFSPQFVLFSKLKDFYPLTSFLLAVLVSICFFFLIFRFKKDKTDLLTKLGVLFYLAGFFWFLTLSISYFELALPFSLIVLANFLYLLGLAKLQFFIERVKISKNSLFVLVFVFQEFLWLLFLFPLTSLSQAVISTFAYILLIQALSFEGLKQT